MKGKRDRDRIASPPPIFIVSGGSGGSGRLIVETALAQFPNLRVPVIVRARVRTRKQAGEAVRNASAAGGVVVHTLVERKLRESLIRLGREHAVVTMDLMGPLLEWIAGRYQDMPLGQPGLYRKLRKDYFDRVEAIDFAVAHDDGMKPEDLPGADIVIIGVSRCGKTPLSMYLAVQGWKVANVPILKDIPPPAELFLAESRKVVGLIIGPERLLEHRKKREERMGTTGPSAYSDPSAISGEIEAAKRIYRDRGFHSVIVTDKPIEIIADEITGFIVASRKDGTGNRASR